MQGIVAAAVFHHSTPQTPTKVVNERCTNCMLCVTVWCPLEVDTQTEIKRKFQTLKERMKVIVETCPKTEDRTLHTRIMCISSASE